MILGFFSIVYILSYSIMYIKEWSGDPYSLFTGKFQPPQKRVCMSGTNNVYVFL